MTVVAPSSSSPRTLTRPAIMQDLETRKAFWQPAAVDACAEPSSRSRRGYRIDWADGVFSGFLGLLINAPERKSQSLAIERGRRIRRTRVRIAPDVVADILRACLAEGFGARPDEYLIDELLGPCLAERQRTGQSRSVAVMAGAPVPVHPCVEGTPNLQSGRAGANGEAIIRHSDLGSAMVMMVVIVVMLMIIIHLIPALLQIACRCRPRS